MNAGCVTCGSLLSGRQRKFCSLACKNRDTNNRLQNYAQQRRRGAERKAALLSRHGNRCSRCGYSKNSAALTWHHVDPATKSFDLDLRALSNRTQSAIEAEFLKCMLLCANCHAEAHFPQFNR